MKLHKITYSHASEVNGLTRSTIVNSSWLVSTHFHKVAQCYVTSVVECIILDDGEVRHPNNAKGYQLCDSTESGVEQAHNDAMGVFDAMFKVSMDLITKAGGTVPC